MATTIIRDTDGIAHIRADDETEAFRGQGFAATEDRLWQMEFDRRKALGRLSEVIGPSALAADRYHLRLGLARAAEADHALLSERTQAMFAAYARGVNDALATLPALPPEFGLLDAPPPAPWEPWHSIAVFKVRHLWMGTAEVKLWRSAVASVVGPAMAARLWPSVPGVHIDPGVVDEVVTMDIDAAVAETSQVLADLETLGTGGAASNNFVLSGSRTATGMPIMAGDPHRAIDLPNVYWQNHVTWPDAGDGGADVIGLSFPGVPGFPHFGHNADVAWSITHGMADDQDLFLEHFGDDDPVVARRIETIQVAGAHAETVECLETANGPVVAGGPDAGVGVAMRWTATAAPDTTYDCLLPQMLARSADDLDAAFSRWVIPCNNVLIADRAGDIAYRFRGRLAVRPHANGWTIVDGANAWTSFVDDVDLTRIRNPSTGVLLTANNPIGDGPYVSHDWAHPARSDRLTELLSHGDAWSTEDALEVLGDTHSAVAASFARRIASLTVRSSAERAAHAQVTSWDHHMDASSSAAVVYAATRAELVRLLSADLGLHRAPVVDGFGYTLGQAMRVVHLRIGFLIDDHDLVPDEMMAEAFRSAVHALTQQLGTDPSRWRWGALHTAGFHHPLAALRPDLAASLDRPDSVELGGDNESIWAAGTIPPSMRSVTSPVARYVFDLSDWDRSGWIVPHGVHGDPTSPHHADQLDRWAAVQLAPMRYSPGAVDDATASVTTLD
ncbi:penicillin acylase family protein [Actinospongicola halichondriae]|uniref:penicillin acylase family protein n=1 Tax=Actinospongicola halichondriae TaxID=3236844 RepID=UPI003D5575AA